MQYILAHVGTASKEPQAEQVNIIVIAHNEECIASNHYIYHQHWLHILLKRSIQTSSMFLSPPERLSFSEENSLDTFR